MNIGDYSEVENEQMQIEIYEITEIRDGVIISRTIELPN